MDEDDIELQIAIEEELARANENELFMQQSPQVKEPGFWEAAIPTWGEVAMAPVNLIKGVASIPSAIGDAGEWAAHMISGYNGETAQPYDRTEGLVKGLETTRDLALSPIPGGRALGNYLTDTDIGPFQGINPDRAASEYGQMVREDLALLPTAALPALYKGARGAVTGARDKVFGLPEKERLARQAANDEIFANKLNAGRGVSRQEDALVENASRYADEFVEANPTAGIDPSQGRVAYEQFENNLKNTKVSNIKVREQQVLPGVAKAETARLEAAARSGEQVKVGVEFDDIPSQVMTEDGLPYGVDNIRRSIPEGEAGVLAAQDFIKEKFGIVQENIYGYEGGPTRTAPGRALTAVELNDLRKAVDGQIREFGGYDDLALASMKPGFTPSMRDGYVEALRYYRNQIDKATKNHIAEMVGPEAAAAFDKAGRQIAMANDYELLAGRFKRETGQAFAPGSAKQVPPGSGPLGTQGMTGKALQAVSPDLARARMETQALQREGNALRQLQQLIEMRRTAYKPAPRGLAQIKASFEDLTNVGTLAMRMGLIGAVDELIQMPDEVATQVVAQVAQNFPQMFEPVPDKINVVDGKYMDPLGKDIVIRGSVDLPAEERAKRIGGAWENKYVPPADTMNYNQQFNQPPQIPDIGSLNNALSSPDLETDFSGSQETRSMLDELENATQVHAYYEVVQ